MLYRHIQVLIASISIGTKQFCKAQFKQKALNFDAGRPSLAVPANDNAYSGLAVWPREAHG